MQVMPRFLVDALPFRWWRHGNLHFIGPWTVHFCCGSSTRVPHAVRTIEVNDREVAQGDRPFDFARCEELSRD